MAQSSILAGAHPPRDAVTATVTIIAEKRTSPDDALGDQRLPGIKGDGRACGVDADGLFFHAVRLIMIKIGAPLPDVSRHIVETVPVRHVRLHRSSSEISDLHRILVRELSLPEVRLPCGGGRRLITPRI